MGLAGATGTILTPMISKHFPNENRSKAAGIVTACGGLGMFIFPIMANIFTKYFWFSWVGKLFYNFFIILFLMCILGFLLTIKKIKIKSQY